ncbi:MAG: TIGR02611 family protein [Actinomycetota bacterium]|nr:TIGR02611 family protein [Actinomycetota bacterium]
MTPAQTQPPGTGRRVVSKFQDGAEKAKSTRAGRIAWRTGIMILGGSVIVVGILLLPLPGPGWLIIFAGLGILATEFDWAKRLLRFARNQVGRWTAWMGRQGRLVQALIGVVGLLSLVALAVGMWVLYR